jgi:hypothetical protein
MKRRLRVSKCNHELETLQNDNLKIIRCSLCGTVKEIILKEPFPLGESYLLEVPPINKEAESDT